MSAPMFVWRVVSHRTCGLASSIGEAPNASCSLGPNTAFRLLVTTGTPGYEPILSLPIRPQLARRLSWLLALTLGKNGSSARFQPSANEGNFPYRFSAPKRDEPSTRSDAVSRYRFR